MQAKKAVSGTGLNVDDIISVLSGIDGVEKAEIGSTTVAKYSDQWSGAVSIPAGTYVKLFTGYHSRVREKVTDKNRGLEGRFWHHDMKCWILPLQPVKYSDNKDVATVKDLLVFIGEKSKADQLFGGN